MFCPTGVLLLHALQQLKLKLDINDMLEELMLHVLYTRHTFNLLRGVACKTNCCMSGSGSTALCARNVHITLYDVITWSWVALY